MKGAGKIPKAGETKTIETASVTTKTLASDSSLEELLKKIGGVSLDTCLSRSELRSEPPNNHCPCPSRGLTTTHTCSLAYRTRREVRQNPFLIPDFVSTATYEGSAEDEQEIGGSTDPRIILRAARSKTKLENISLSMWVAANGRIMHKLTNTEKLSGMVEITDYLSYNIANVSNSTAFAGAAIPSISIRGFS